MKIVISPAKSLDLNSAIPTAESSEPCFKEEAAYLNELLRKKSPKQLAQIMDISSNLANLNWQRNQDWTQEEPGGRQAIYTFDGDVYKGLNSFSIPLEKMIFLQDILRILSGLYGILKPLDLIHPYRLEMGSNLKIGRNKDLYDFWKRKVTTKLNEELSVGEIFLNLASQEYFKAIDTKVLKTPVITPEFKELRNGKLTMISFFAKRARGSMVRYIVDKGAETMDELKAFNYDNYRFSEAHSTTTSWVFIR